MQSWWGGSGKFNVQFVGEGSFGRDLVVLFNSPVKDAAGAHIHVRDAHGNKVSGSWEASPKNDKMLILKKLKYGKYTVSIDADLPDASGDKLGSASKGSIWID